MENHTHDHTDARFSAATPGGTTAMKVGSLFSGALFSDIESWQAKRPAFRVLEAEMTDLDKLVRQTRFGNPDGNCLEACIATITGLALEEIPHFLGDDWFADYRGWLGEKGWNVAWWDAGEGAEPSGLAIASGPSVRGLPHSVVYRDGVFHDPHPSDAGLIEVQYWLLLWPVSWPSLIVDAALGGTR